MPHCLAWRFTYNDETFVWTYMRSKSAGAASEADKAALKPLMARASAAAILATKAAKTRLLGLLEGLSACKVAALALGPRAAVRDVTLYAESLFPEEFTVRSGRIHIADRSVGPALRMLEQALSPNEPGGEMRGFAFDTSNGRILALPMRLPAAAMDFFSGVRALLLRSRSPSAFRDVRVSLTRAERIREARSRLIYRERNKGIREDLTIARVTPPKIISCMRA